MSLIDVLIKAQLLTHVHKAELARFFASICWKSNFRNTQVLPPPAHYLVGFLAHSIGTWSQRSRHPLFKEFELLKPLGA